MNEVLLQPALLPPCYRLPGMIVGVATMAIAGREHSRALEFSRCMRSHALPGSLGTTAKGRRVRPSSSSAVAPGSQKSRGAERAYQHIGGGLVPAPKGN
jgi:hypothetical protein